MAYLVVRHQVKDYSAWKKEFDSHAGLRTSNGEVSTQIFRDASDPNKVTVINKWNSMANAQKFVNSPELKAAMEKSGVVGISEISFQNEE